VPDEAPGQYCSGNFQGTARAGVLASGVLPALVGSTPHTPEMAGRLAGTPAICPLPPTLVCSAVENGTAWPDQAKLAAGRISPREGMR
jgi:hypothetical protein